MDNKKSTSKKVRVGITIGDLNGIGLEVIMKALSDSRILSFCIPIVYGNPKAVGFHRKAVRMFDFNFNIIDSAKDAQSRKPNLVALNNDVIPIELGKASEETGKFAVQSLKAATDDLANGLIDVIVTAPIDKNTAQGEDFNFPGHTEFFTKLSNVSESLMLMVADELRVGLVTNHVPLKDVASTLTKELIIAKAKLLEQTLTKDFGIIKPKIAILGLNPHAGDKGLLGEEEGTIIKPAVKDLNQEKILAFGPYPADGFFGSGTAAQFDGVLAMYHDQGLAPFKAMTFDSGVNYTAGLPVVRTSPDHGVAYDIAGKGQASESSMRNAIYLACDVFNARINHKEMTANPLEIQERKNNRRDR